MARSLALACMALIALAATVQGRELAQAKPAAPAPTPAKPATPATPVAKPAATNTTAVAGRTTAAPKVYPMNVKSADPKIVKSLNGTSAAGARAGIGRFEYTGATTVRQFDSGYVCQATRTCYIQSVCCKYNTMTSSWDSCKVRDKNGCPADATEVCCAQQGNSAGK